MSGLRQFLSLLTNTVHKIINKLLFIYELSKMQWLTVITQSQCIDE